MTRTYVDMDRTPKPKSGDEVHLVMLEHSAYMYAKPTWVLDGTVIDTFWWEARDLQCFALRVRNYLEDFVPLRSVRMNHVVSINGVLVHGWDEVVGERLLEWPVKGSRGDDYVVRQHGSRWTCQCRGFSFHRHCRHIDEVVAGKWGQPNSVEVVNGEEANLRGPQNVTTTLRGSG